MAEQSSLSSPSHNQTRPLSSFFGSPRFFTGFLGKSPIETEKLSPTSILDIKPLSPVSPHFPATKHSWAKSDPIGVGLALVDSLNGDERVLNDSSQPKMVLFGSKLKVQIPQIPPSSVSSPTGSPNSPADFGIKTRNFQTPGQFSPFGSKDVPPATFTRQLSVKEMELSEDYTCVISHGPNPKTTHIYDNCVVESCCGVVGLSDLEKKHCLSENLNSPPASFLSFCCNCKKNLQQGKGIFMYRGEKAFCSPECRCQEMLFVAVENPE